MISELFKPQQEVITTAEVLKLHVARKLEDLDRVREALGKFVGKQDASGAEVMSDQQGALYFQELKHIVERGKEAVHENTETSTPRMGS